jgi:hypothetical protein
MEDRPPQSNTAVIIVCAAIGMILAAAGLWAFWPVYDSYTLTSRAKNYLSAVSQERYENAYELLSPSSKKNCTLPRYKALNQEKPAKMSGFRIVTIAEKRPHNALIVYEALTQNGQWQPAYASFLKENGTWGKVYLENTIPSISEYIRAGKNEAAVKAARKVYDMDPFDIRTLAALCEAEFNGGLYKYAVKSCSETLSANEEYGYPYQAETESFYRLYLAVSQNQMGLKDKAKTSLETLFKRKTAPEVYCRAGLEYATLSAENGGRKAALKIVSQVAPSCTGTEDTASAQEMIDILSGSAVGEAVRLAKLYREKPSSDTILEIWLSERKGIIRSLGHASAPRETWSAQGLGDGMYIVTLVLGPGATADKKTIPAKTIFTLKVDLWKKTVKMES